MENLTTHCAQLVLYNAPKRVPAAPEAQGALMLADGP